jgi:protein ImuA
MNNPRLTMAECAHLIPSPAEEAAVRIGELRRQLAALEAAGECGALLALGNPVIDSVLGGGLGCGALHEIVAAREREVTVASGFALALAARMTSARGIANSRDARNDARVPSTVLWITEDLSLAENGALYGPGLDGIGIAPERLITVAAARGRGVLWAMEEALRCHAVGMVIGEMRPRGIDQVATRRLALAAAAGNALGLILYTTSDETPSAAVTRWSIGAAAPLDTERSHGVGPPRFLARLVRNRRGPLGTWIVEWNSVEQRFELATHSEPVAGAAFDRPRRTAVA